MEDIKIKVCENGISCTKGFLTVSTYRDLAPSLEKFWDVLAATEAFAPKTISRLIYNASSRTVYVYGIETILASKTFSAGPTEKEMEMALFGMLPDIIQGEEEE